MSAFSAGNVSTLLDAWSAYMNAAARGDVAGAAQLKQQLDALRAAAGMSAYNSPYTEADIKAIAAQPHYDPSLLANTGGQTAPVAPYQQPPQAQPAQTRLIFRNVTTGNAQTVRVGDAWKVEITGAAPNAPVAVTGGKDGATSTTPMGSTDGTGRYALNGTSGQDGIGIWAETWFVGGASVGSFSFTVVAPTAGTQQPPPPGGQQTTPPPATKDGPNVNAMFETLKSIPWWVWVAGGAFWSWRGRAS